MSDKSYEVLGVEAAYRGYFRLGRWRVRHSLFAGGWSAEQVREVLERGHAAAVLPYDPRTDRVVLIEQFRAAAAPTTEPPWLIEVPAGIIDGGETPEETIRREAREEAGLDLDRLTYVTRFPKLPGHAYDEGIAVYAGLHRGIRVQPGEHIAALRPGAARKEAAAHLHPTRVQRPRTRRSKPPRRRRCCTT
jgi:ADP-ribose pyrophosphatase